MSHRLNGKITDAEADAIVLKIWQHLPENPVKPGSFIHVTYKGLIFAVLIDRDQVTQLPHLTLQYEGRQELVVVGRNLGVI